MSRHEGVSCDSCLKGNFRGRRYKCLICYDYDLCEACYEKNATSTRHSVEHPMQCILTRADYELYYGGEPLHIIDTPQSFTCPYCNKMGLTEVQLSEHVSNEHTDASCEVICPICAALPGGDPNVMTEDLCGHLALEHRAGSRDLISFLDEPVTSRSHNIRRLPHTGRGTGAARTRRTNMYFNVTGGFSLASRDTVDPLVELLPQLSDVRHTTTSPGISTTASQRSQLQHLQRQLQLEHSQATRYHIERISRPQIQNPTISNNNNTATTTIPSTPIPHTNSKNNSIISTNSKTKYLLESLFNEKSKSNINEENKSYRSFFIQDMLLSIKKDDINLARFAKLFPEDTSKRLNLDTRLNVGKKKEQKTRNEAI